MGGSHFSRHISISFSSNHWFSVRLWKIHRSRFQRVRHHLVQCLLVGKFCDEGKFWREILFCSVRFGSEKEFSHQKAASEHYECFLVCFWRLKTTNSNNNKRKNHREPTKKEPFWRFTRCVWSDWKGTTYLFPSGWGESRSDSGEAGRTWELNSLRGSFWLSRSKIWTVLSFTATAFFKQESATINQCWTRLNVTCSDWQNKLRFEYTLETGSFEVSCARMRGFANL